MGQTINEVGARAEYLRLKREAESRWASDIAWAQRVAVDAQVEAAEHPERYTMMGPPSVGTMVSYLAVGRALVGR